MDPLYKPVKQILECDIQSALIQRFTIDGWLCVRTHGNAHQSGFPDIFMCHQRYGQRWVEVKRPKGYSFTQAQVDVFTKFASKNIGVWVMTANTDYERRVIFRPSNWCWYLKSVKKLNSDVKRIKKYGPEGIIQDKIIDKLKADDWFCIETYGSIFQSGLPDIYCCHRKYGQKWIECKNPAGYKFTPAQVGLFPKLAAHGVGIWILTDVNDSEKIFGPSNWHNYMWR